MAASVTVHHKAFGDERIDRLAELAGYSRHEALGRLVRLWSVCTELQTNGVLPVARVRACLGNDGDRHMVEADLGEWHQAPDNHTPQHVRVKGCDGRIEWFGDQQATPDKRARGGQKRATGAVRDRGGRFQQGRDRSSTPSSSASSSPANAGISPGNQIQIQDQNEERERASLPEQQSARDLPDDRASTQENLIPFPRSSPEQSANSPQSTSSPQSPEDQERALEPALRKSADEMVERRRLVDEVRDRLRVLRATIAKELGEDVRPLPLQGRGEMALAARIRESGAIEQARADCEHVLAIMAAEARAERSVRWLMDSAFEEKSWRCKLGMTLRDIRGTQAGRAAAGDGPPTKLPGLEFWGQS